MFSTYATRGVSTCSDESLETWETDSCFSVRSELLKLDIIRAMVERGVSRRLTENNCALEADSDRNNGRRSVDLIIEGNL